MIDEQQQWLPFDFLEEEKQIRTEELPHFENPQNDNECLLELQYQYRVNGKREALDEIFKRGVIICGKMISKETKSNPHIKHLSMEDRKMKAIDATAYIISSYLRKPQWFIKSSITSYFYKRVMKELYNQRKVDKIVDFVDWDTFYKEGEEDREEDEWLEN